MRRLALIISALPALIASPTAAQGQPPLTVEVLRTGDGSLNVNITLIKGEHDAVMVDAPFTLADAHRAVAMVLDSGKRLTHLYVTHDHPDHFFAMEVIRDAFPEVQIVAHPQVVDDIWKSLPFKVKRWSPMLGANGPVHPSAPAPLAGDTIMLEGRELKVIGPMQGDHHHATALWAPSIRALFAGDLVFHEMHLWLGEHDNAQVAQWAAALDRLAELQPAIVVPGHSAPQTAVGMADSPSAITYSQRYLAAWRRLVPLAQDSADLRARIKAEFPNTIDALGDFILGNSSQVHMGEQPKWQE